MHAAGPAGCLLASKLAASPLRPAVALVEAGPDAIDIPLAAKRFQVLGENPQLDYAYKTTKQPSLGGREMVLSRGKGLGGSTLLNFQVWQLGARDEFEEWAGLVGDDDWKFDRVMKRLKQVRVALQYRCPCLTAKTEYETEYELRVSKARKI